MTKPRVLLYCAVGGLPVTIAALGTGHFAWWWLSGILLAASFVPVALYGRRSWAGQFGVIAPALFFITVLCTWSEGVLFVPEVRQHALGNLVGSAVMYLIVAAGLAAVAVLLKLPRPQERALERRPAVVAIAMVVLCGFAYAFYYFVFGAITYQYFTKGYYPEATQMVARMGLAFWALQIGRGMLMTIAVIPAIYTLRMGRWQTAVAIGALVWIAGGAAPLLVPNPYMGDTQRFIHIVEILTQNASLGVTAVLLLRPRRMTVQDLTQLAVAAR